jgi:hypothetical protein
MKIRWMLVLVLLGSPAFGQTTTINIGTQGRNFDFSNAPFTRPATVGTTLPATCTLGQFFFNSAAAAGQNLYACTAANVWTTVGNGPQSGPLTAQALAGVFQADQLTTSSITNGIANSLNLCSTGQSCIINAPPTYNRTEAQPWGGANFPSGTSYFNTTGPSSASPVAGLLDERYGVPQWIFNSSLATDARHNASPAIVMNSTSANQGLYSHFPDSLLLINTAFSGGRNNHQTLSDKTNHAGAELYNFKYTQAQGGGALAESIRCFGNGDCVGHTIDTITYGNLNTQGDEGAQGQREETIEGGETFSAKIAAIATNTTDSTTTITTSFPSYNGFQGEGRLAIDLTQVYKTGYISSISTVSGETQYVCSGCTWDSTYGVSTKTTLTADIGNGTATSNTFPQTNVAVSVGSSAGFTAGNLACFYDFDYECALLTSVPDSTHLVVAKLFYPHVSGGYVVTGGLTGYAIELEADRVDPTNTNGIATSPDSTLVRTTRFAAPIMYSSSGNKLNVFQPSGSPAGQLGGYQGRAYVTMGSGGTATPTFSGTLTALACSGGTGYVSNGPPQLIMTGTWTTAPSAHVSTISGGAITACTIDNPGSGITALTVTVTPKNQYDIYPATKVTGVYNLSIGSVDGTLYTQPLVGTWRTNDTVENPHYFYAHNSGSNNVVGQYMPAYAYAAHSGLRYSLVGLWGGNDSATNFVNKTNPLVYTNYQGGTPWIIGQGQYGPPDGHFLGGPFKSGLHLDTPVIGSSGTGVISVDCGTLGCASLTNAYPVIRVKNGAGGEDVLKYTASTGNWSLTAGATGSQGNGAACALNVYTFGVYLKCGSNQIYMDTTGKLNTNTISATGLTINGAAVTAHLIGTTGSIGGSALAAGACSSGTSTVTGATTGMAVALGTYPGDGFYAQGYVSAANTVTVKVCAVVSGTPAAQTYSVRVMQ